ncbi:unnamed protein product [Oikopleura dioica]|uniref:Innexin n=1 Tax=Oikopleura dioica TaxID=34765 RepID=E4XI20_OIKDI|nr:unnamed protein product [Oikopleura dioica]
MLSLAADAIFANAKTNTGDTKVSKASLPNDNIITLLAVGSPILLISFALVFSPNLATENGLRCAPTSPMKNRFYMYNYCWENFNHYELNFTEHGILEVGEPRWMIHHKAFPYAFFLVAFILGMPAINWVLAYSDNVKRQATYIMSGLEEALALTLSLMSDLVQEKSQEKTTENVKDRMNAMLEENYSDEIDIKFKAFKKYLQKKNSSTKLARAFIQRRVFTLVLLILVGIFMYEIYYLDNQDFFNCKLKYQPLGTVQEGISYVRCSIGDVSTRRLLVQIYLAVIGACFVGIFVITIKDALNAHRAFKLLEMIPIIDENEINNSANFFGLRDIHILLFLAKSNFSENELFKTCHRAYEMSRMTNIPYENMIETIVSWGAEDEADKDAAEVLETLQ